MPWRNVEDIKLSYDPEEYVRFYPDGLKEGTYIDIWGVAHEPGSAAAKHMTYMRNPMKHMETLEEVMEYPFLDYSKGDRSHPKRQVEEIHDQGLAAVGNMQVTIWETAWYIRGMENLMVDMSCEPEIAEWVFNKVTEQSLIRAKAYAEAGVDVLNPIQSECMNFKEIYEEYGGNISFHGTIGTQTTMPFGTPEEVKRVVKENLDIARTKGGLFVAPTHLMEPEVPWENILAYVEAFREYDPKK